MSDYLALYYHSDADVQADPELAAWFDELVSIEGGRVPGIGPRGANCTLGYLAEAATLIIFTSSVQHAAVNFPQYDLMSYVPNMPLAGYTPAPTKKGVLTEADFLANLPPCECPPPDEPRPPPRPDPLHHPRRIPRGPLPRPPRRRAPRARFQKDLKNIGRGIEERNRSRRPYEFLVPSGIPQSINI